MALRDARCLAQGFHAWLSRSPSARARGDEARAAQVKASFVGSGRTCGARRVWHDVLAEGARAGCTALSG